MLAATLALLTAASSVKGWYFPPEAPGVINPLGKGQECVPLPALRILADGPARPPCGGTTRARARMSTFSRISTLRPMCTYGYRPTSRTCSMTSPTVRLRPAWSCSPDRADRLDHTVYTFADNIATEAPDLSATPDGHWVMYISAVQINTIFVIRSDTPDPLGPWTSYGTVKHDGADIVGYDAHAIVLPSGDRYLAWSTSYHAPPSISLIKLANITHAVEGSKLSAVIVPNQPYEQNGSSSP